MCAMRKKGPQPKVREYSRAAASGSGTWYASCAGFKVSKSMWQPAGPGSTQLAQGSGAIPGARRSANLGEEGGDGGAVFDEFHHGAGMGVGGNVGEPHTVGGRSPLDRLYAFGSQVPQLCVQVIAQNADM